MDRNIWRFMGIECRNSIKKPFGISLPVGKAPLEQWCMNAVTVATCIFCIAAVAIGIVPTASMIKQIIGLISK
jgi:hypothetical protein